MERSPQTLDTPTMPAKQPSTLAIAVRSGAGLAIAGAIIGGVLTAAAFGGLSALGVGVSAAADAVPVIGGLVNITGPLTAALSGLAIGGAGGAIMGAPAGIVAGPIYVKQKMAEMENFQLKSAMPYVAEQGAQQAIATVMEKAQEAKQESAQAFHNEAAKGGHVDALMAKREAAQTASQTQEIA